MNVMMDGAQGGTSSNAPPPFLTKTYDMVEDTYSNPIVSWSHNGNSFIVWNPPDFARDLLPKYFKHNNFSSFVRQLNTYGFRKIDPDQWEFANEEFVRGQRHLLKNIHRRKPIHSHSTQHQGNSSVPLSDSDRREFEEEIERLKSDNTMLQAELHKYKHGNQEYEYQVCSLSERLQKIELGQRKMMASLAHLLQNPTVPPRFLEQVEINRKKRRLLISSYLNNEASNGDNEIITFQEESSDVKSIAVLTIELVKKLSTSLNFWGNFLDGVAHSSGEEMFSFGVNLQPSPSVSHTRNSFPSHLRDKYSSPELAGSSNHADNMAIFPHVKSSEIDVNKEPFRADNVDQTPEMRSGPNDVFWEQFLTETPGSDTQEVQSERREIDIRKNEDKTASERKYSWNTNNLDNLTEQMGLLRPSEKITG